MVRHLPPQVRRLLAQRNTLLLRSSAKLNQVFDCTLRDAKEKGAETGWLVLTVHTNHFPLFRELTLTSQTCVLLTTNRPSCIGPLYHFITRSLLSDVTSRVNLTEAVRRAAVMRESALKSVIFVGVPRVSTR
jgi:hypothetical protein